jgi:hypothetical protein
VKSIRGLLAAEALVSIAILVAACGKGSDPVRDCLEGVTRAAHKRDAGALFERVTADFQSGEGASRAQAQDLARRYFAAYEKLDVTLSDVQIERSDNAARARFRAELSGQLRKIAGLDALFPRSSTYDFDVRLVPEDGKWKIAWAEWREASR